MGDGVLGDGVLGDGERGGARGWFVLVKETRRFANIR